ncbi:hypothetical protein AAU61_03435 [Desulfocarbo indianensis]|nr:hypothetical protein AAU61_03435 [Desulfocarbo indianensis]
MIKRVFALIFPALLALSLAWPAAGQESISLVGSTSLLPLSQHLAEAYMLRHPQVRVSVAGRGSGVGVRAIIDGTADIAGVSRELSAREIDLCEKRGVKPVAHLAALGCVVPVVDRANPVAGLSREQLKDVYAGKINSWRALGGPARPIAVMNRDTNSGSMVLFRLLVMGGGRVRRDALMLASNGAMVQAVAGNPLALGYVGLGYLEPRLKPLAINGVAASLATVRSGAYPLSRHLYLLTGGRPQGRVKEFLDFMAGPQGQEIVRRQGLIPVR